MYCRSYISMLEDIKSIKTTLLAVFEKLSHESLIYTIFHEMLVKDVLDDAYVKKLHDKVMNDGKSLILKKWEAFSYKIVDHSHLEDKEEAEKILEQLLWV